MGSLFCLIYPFHTSDQDNTHLSVQPSDGALLKPYSIKTSEWEITWRKQVRTTVDLWSPSIANYAFQWIIPIFDFDFVIDFDFDFELNFHFDFGLGLDLDEHQHNHVVP